MHIFPKKKITVWDGALLGFLGLISTVMLICGILSDSGEQFTISSAGNTASYSMTDDREYTVTSQGFTLTVTVSDGRVCVTDSDCPDHTCEHSGSISRGGEVIVCVPAGVVIRIIPSVDEDHGGQNEDFVIG